VPPPYDDPDLLSLYVQDPPADAPQRHLALFISDVRAKISVPTLRSFLKLYSSLDTKKLSNFLDADEEDIVQQMMVLKQASRSIGRAGLDGGRLLDGEMISTSDLDFAINENMVHIVESTIGRRYGSLFIKNTEYAQRIFDNLRNSPLPISKPAAATTTTEPTPAPPQPQKPKVTWAK